MDNAQVYRGANDNQVGGLTLGGAINFATPTVQDSDQDTAKLMLHHEMGSFGEQRSQMSSAQQFGDLDY